MVQIDSKKLCLSYNAVTNWPVLYFTGTTEEKSERKFCPTNKPDFFFLPSYPQVKREESEVAAVAWAALQMARSQWYSSLYFRMKVRVYQILSPTSVSSGHPIDGKDYSRSSDGLISEYHASSNIQLASFFHTWKSTYWIRNISYLLSEKWLIKKQIKSIA